MLLSNEESVEKGHEICKLNQLDYQKIRVLLEDVIL